MPLAYQESGLLRSKGIWSAVVEMCLAEITFLFVDYVLSKALAAHQGNYGVSYSAPSAAVSVLGTPASCQNNGCGGRRGSTENPFISWLPAHGSRAPTSIRAACRVGILCPCWAGGRASTARLPRAFPVAPGNHSNTP